MKKSFLFKICPLNPEISKKSFFKKFKAKNRSNVPTFQQNAGQKNKTLIMNNIIIINRKIIIISCWNELFFVGMSFFLGCFVGMRIFKKKFLLEWGFLIPTRGIKLHMCKSALCGFVGIVGNVIPTRNMYYITHLQYFNTFCWNVGMKKRKSGQI